MVIDGINGKIICVSEEKGAVHDFEMFKRSEIHLLDGMLLIGDKGFQGICGIHARSLTPFRKPRKGDLSVGQKKFNSDLSKCRMLIEHVNRRIKRFKLLQIRYRNKQRKHLLRVSLICGIYNYELGF